MYKKITTLIIGLFIGIITTAQPHLCDDPCTLGPKLWKTIALCKVGQTIEFIPAGIPDANHMNSPFVFVTIAYRIKTCPGPPSSLSVVIEDYVYVDNRDFWLNHAYEPTVVELSSLPIIPTTSITNCPYPPASIQQAITDAISLLMNEIAINTQSHYDVYFKGACYSLVNLTFPDRSFFLGTPDDLGAVDTFFLSAGSTVAHRIPCNNACCKVTYEWKAITLEDGETISKWVPISYEGDNESCEQSPLPDYNTFPDKLEATIFDSINNTYIQVGGTIVGQEPCELTCPRFIAPPPEDFGARIKTDLTEKETSLVFSATPTLVNDFLTIKSNIPIQSIVLYDIKGNRVQKKAKLENNVLHTDELKEGMYFLQVIFQNNQVRTVKILKN